MLQIDFFGSVLFQVFARVDTCSTEELNEKLPSHSCSWNEVFAVVDRFT
jgi:hypothetical protein